MDAKDFFNEEQRNLLMQTIRNAEHKSTGEIRLHVEGECEGDPLKRAVHVFHHLHMHKTKHHNAVLFYLATEHKKLAIVGDTAIHKEVTEEFWHKVKDHIISRFKEEKFTEGMCEGIEMTGEELKKHFPRNGNNKHQLSDEISYGH